MSQLLVKDLMSESPISVTPTTPLHDVIRLMESHEIRHMPVLEADGHLVGLLSHRDVLQSQEGTLSGVPAQDQSSMNRWIEARWLMTKEVRTVHPDTPALDAAQTLRSYRYGCLPVLEEGKVVGMLTEADFVDYAIQVLSDPGV